VPKTGGLTPDRSAQSPNVPKTSAEDTVLTAHNAAGEARTVPVPAGTILYINIPALHYNRQSRPHPAQT
jgi:hypothetical protein